MCTIDTAETAHFDLKEGVVESLYHSNRPKGKIHVRCSNAVKG